LLVVSLSLSAAAWALLRHVAPGARRRALIAAALVGVAGMIGSTALVSRRHAGMGTEIARGWPRVVHSRWESFDGSERRAGVHVRGAMENALAYGAAAALLGALATAAMTARARRA
jgi:hypothetical protein